MAKVRGKEEKLLQSKEGQLFLGKQEQSSIESALLNLEERVLFFWLIRCRMQTKLFTESTRVVVWQQKSLSAFLGTLAVDNKSHLQTMPHF